MTCQIKHKNQTSINTTIKFNANYKKVRSKIYYVYGGVTSRCVSGISNYLVL